jgi:uncharacterized protein
MPAPAAPIESPCIKVCRLEPVLDLCVGCGRTVAEIGGWLAFDPQERRRIAALLPARLASLLPERGVP